MPQSVREQLEALNEECKEFCLAKSNWTAKWRGADEADNPNFLLAYSSVDTFQRPGGVMILGTNPAGDHTVAHRYPISSPFDPSQPRWSSYLDDRWEKAAGEDKRQRAVRRIADIVAGDSGDGDELLRMSQTGNLIPFRSNEPGHLKTSGRGTTTPYEVGLSVGWQLIRIARPRVLILTASNGSRWSWLMGKFAGRVAQECPWDLPGSNRTFREAIIGGSRPRPEFIWALPRVNTGTAGPRPGEELRKRLRKYGVGVRSNGQVRVSKR